MASEVEPDQIGDQASGDGYTERHEGVHQPHGPKGSRPQQPGSCWNWQANLFQENDREQQQSAVIRQEARGFAHQLPRRLVWLAIELIDGLLQLMNSNACPSGSRTMALLEGLEEFSGTRADPADTKWAP